METYSARTYKAYVTGKKLCLSQYHDELLKLCEWLNSNKLSLNVSKSSFVIFYPYQRKLYREVTLKYLTITRSNWYLLNVRHM